MKSVSARLIVVVVAGLCVGQVLRAQTFLRGQNVSPAFEGWEENPDGTRYFVFGYMNRNWEEELDVPVGPENTIEPGGPDFGQPTHFLPRRNRFAFRVPVPKGFGEKDEMTWTLTTRGKTEKAFATLATDYRVDAMVRASETGALGAGTSSPEVRANKAPLLKVDGAKQHTVRVGQPLTLVAWVTDDGVPKPRRSDEARVRARTDLPVGATPPRNPAYRPASSKYGRKRNGVTPVVVRVSRPGAGCVRPPASQGVGGHARRRKLTVGRVVADPAAPTRKQVDDDGHLRQTGHLRFESPRLRRGGRHRRRDYRDRGALTCELTLGT